MSRTRWDGSRGLLLCWMLLTVTNGCQSMGGAARLPGMGWLAKQNGKGNHPANAPLASSTLPAPSATVNPQLVAQNDSSRPGGISAPSGATPPSAGFSPPASASYPTTGIPPAGYPTTGYPAVAQTVPPASSVATTAPPASSAAAAPTEDPSYVQQGYYTASADSAAGRASQGAVTTWETPAAAAVPNAVSPPANAAPTGIMNSAPLYGAMSTGSSDLSSASDSTTALPSGSMAAADGVAQPAVYAQLGNDPTVPATYSRVTDLLQPQGDMGAVEVASHYDRATESPARMESTGGASAARMSRPWHPGSTSSVSPATSP